MLRLTDFQSYIDATILVKTGVFYWVQIKKSRKLISETQANIEQYFLRCFPVLIATYIYKNGKHHTLNDTTWYLKKITNLLWAFQDVFFLMREIPNNISGMPVSQFKSLYHSRR